jgi:hypothetical protein
MNGPLYAFYAFFAAINGFFNYYIKNIINMRSTDAIPLIINDILLKSDFSLLNLVYAYTAAPTQITMPSNKLVSHPMRKPITLSMIGRSLSICSWLELEGFVIWG